MLVDSYPVDLDINLCGELQHFHCYMRARSNNTGETKFSHHDLYNSLVEDKIQSVFPNVEIALSIFLKLMISNCSTQRSFSQLKRIRNFKRTAMCQYRLDALSLLCIEADMLRRVSFEEIIKDFAIRKSRKKLF